MNKANIAFFSGLYQNHPNTVLLLDRVMGCVYSNAPKVFSEGQSLLNVVRDPLCYPLKEFTEIKVLLGGEYCCARITPVKNELGEAELYICEIIGGEAALETAQKTDAAAKLLPPLTSVERSLSALWQQSTALRSRLLSLGDFEALNYLGSMEAALADISSVSKNMSEYTDMMFSENAPVCTDAVALVTKLMERCNAALAKCGRRVDFVCEPEELFVMVDSRHAVAALINAVQNALLYSPRDTVPTAVLYRTGTERHGLVVFSITNENMLFTDEDFKDAVGVNFSYQRLGYGIPIIKRFAAEAHGSFSLTKDNGRVTAKLSLPAASPAEGSAVRFESPSAVAYDTGVPDIVDIKLREVVSLFGEI